MERQQAADAPEAEGNHHAHQNVVRVCATVRRQRVRGRCAVCWWSGDALTWVSIDSLAPFNLLEAQRDT
jgi:hypothetical protein